LSFSAPAQNSSLKKRYFLNKYPDAINATKGKRDKTMLFISLLEFYCGLLLLAITLAYSYIKDNENS